MIPKATKVAVVGMLAASNVNFSQVSAVQIRNKFIDTTAAEEWNPELVEDHSLIDTKQQLAMVEEQLNEMRAETEVDLELAEEESRKEAMEKRHRKKKGKH